MGTIQAVSFLKSILPFYRLMMGVDIPKVDAWKKVLTYTKAVFQRIHEVRTISSDNEVEGMLYDMLLSTEMLEEYKMLGWIRHPDVSAALI